MKKYVQLLLVLPLLAVCTKKNDEQGIVRIGQQTISKSQFDAFEKVTRMYPTETCPYFPAYRSKITHLIETELLFKQSGTGAVKDSLKKTADWAWKQRYFPAQMVFIDYIIENLAIPDDQIKSYYDAHKESFKDSVRITPPKDSTKKEVAARDSVYYRKIEDVKRTIVDSLFIMANKPDSAFLTRIDTSASKQVINEQWLQYVRETVSTFFMKKIYKEMTGSAYPDSLKDIFGEGKYITQPDMNVILSWIPESRRQFYDSPEQKRELVEWLVKWKLFASYGEKLGRNKLPAVKQVMAWAWKLNVVYAFIPTRLEPTLKSAIVLDTAMLMYALFDDNGYTPVAKGSNQIEGKILSVKEERMRMKVDSVLISYRAANPITFLQKDWVDLKSEKPADMLVKADALRDSGKTNEAKDAYHNLAKEFPLFAEGQSATVELAKLETEQQLYLQAIGNYRNYLLTCPDKSKRCNTFFMIGFIYDEYLDKPLHAEENYKWVLKNAPECELADDAEFMMLHLGEPMSSVEELRDEALRQGRKVEASDENAGAVDTMQTSMKADTK